MTLISAMAMAVHQVAAADAMDELVDAAITITSDKYYGDAAPSSNLGGQGVPPKFSNEAAVERNG